MVVFAVLLMHFSAWVWD